ncbi:hypothetical protein M406DRAFT_103138 [Cryphonectria parasitica EP155]|uniref:Uncharacterized protein n=1 Tax=Cryphonectria parasitica (strain ATCC 38755 / EP155) TaxID=660469 RepID=A0A9P4XX69_CRYP1|nr:uncharacterized protein M406DRAFT_103138 [Cryphonectria parasitica EP155]KAF3762415.1 hypothetical protein M406DRAFT_103138 [Cryphonectria parasitica EP155]
MGRIQREHRLSGAVSSLVALLLGLLHRNSIPSTPPPPPSCRPLLVLSPGPAVVKRSEKSSLEEIKKIRNIRKREREGRGESAGLGWRIAMGSLSLMR